MGQHKDKDTLDFIDYLKKKGADLGFVSETEYKLYKDEYFVDLVWKLQENQKPLFTFEIETSDNERVFSNTDKIFGTPSSTVVKPWRHFMIIYKSKLSEGHRNSLHNILDQHNILLFENVISDKTEKERLEKALTDSAFDITELVKNQLSCKPLGEALPQVMEGIKKGLEGLIPNSEISLTFKSKDLLPEGGIPLSIKVATPKGQPTFYEKLKQSQATNQPFSIESPQLKEVLIGDKAFFSVSDKTKLTFVPSTPILLKTQVTVPGKNIKLDGMVFRRTKIEGTKLYLSTEQRSLPFTVEFTLDKAKTAGVFGFKFDAAKADVKQALLYEEFIRALNATKELRIIDADSQKVIFGGEIHKEYPTDDKWYEIFSKLAYIQEKTKHIIPCPTKVTKEDLQAIGKIIRIIDTGREITSVDNITLTINKGGALEFADRFKKNPKLADLVINQESWALLFGQKISLGHNKVILPDMQLAIPLEQLQASISKMKERSSLKLVLRPIENKEIHSEYADWLPANS